MITPSFSLTASERVLPRLALDFTTAVLDPRVTCTRTTGASNPATYINSSGYVALATNNQPRFDHNSITLACKGLLIEESRTNNQLQSSDFSSAVWNKSGSSVGAGVTSPDGSSVANKITEDTSTGAHRVFTNVGIVTVASTDYTISVFAKSAGRNLQLLNNNLTGAIFDLVNGTVSGSGTIEALKDGWYRCSITSQPGITDRIVAYLYNGSSNSYTGDGSSGIYLWGSQHERGSFVTSHIPTTTISLTRNADNVQMTGTNFSSWYNQNEGTFEVSVDLKAKSVADNYPLRIAGGTNAIVIGYNETATLVRPINTSTTGATVTISAAAYTAVGGYSYTANKVRGAANATLSGTETAAGTVGVNTLAYIGSFNGGAGMLNGWISKIMYWPQRLTNNEVQAFSKA